MHLKVCTQDDINQYVDVRTENPRALVREIGMEVFRDAGYDIVLSELEIVHLGRISDTLRVGSSARMQICPPRSTTFWSSLSTGLAEHSGDEFLFREIRLLIEIGCSCDAPEVAVQFRAFGDYLQDALALRSDRCGEAEAIMSGSADQGEVFGVVGVGRSGLRENVSQKLTGLDKDVEVIEARLLEVDASLSVIRGERGRLRDLESRARAAGGAVAQLRSTYMRGSAEVDLDPLAELSVPPRLSVRSTIGEFIQLVAGWFGEPKDLRPLYAVPYAGYSHAGWHEACDGKGRTLALIALDWGGMPCIVGGFTALPWGTNPGTYADPSNETAVFSLRNSPGDRPDLLRLRQGSAALYHSGYSGPCFSRDNVLGIHAEPARIWAGKPDSRYWECRTGRPAQKGLVIKACPEGMLFQRVETWSW